MAQKFTGQGVTKYFTTNPVGVIYEIRAHSPGVPLAANSGTCTITRANDAPDIILNQQNALDIIAALTNFAATGVFS